MSTSRKKTPSKKKISDLKITPSLEQFGQQIIFQGVNTHNLKNIDITLPKNKLITITGVSGSGKSSLAFDTIYKEGQFRYIESLSSYLRQFFNLGTRPEIDYCAGLSPAIAIEQNKKAGNSRSTIGTLTEIDDYLRLLFAKLGDLYCYGCGRQIKTHTIEQMVDEIKQYFLNKKIYLLQELTTFSNKEDLLLFAKKNRNKVDKGKGFTRYLLLSKSSDTKKNQPIEYFYLENPNVPANFFPIDVYGIFDRVTIEEQKIPRLKEDIIKILGQAKKFGVYCEDVDFSESSIKKKKKSDIQSTDILQNEQGIWRFTDKMFCAQCNISYPDFTTQHFSPNRQEGACANCHGIGEVLQVDFDKVLDPLSPYTQAILPRRDSALGQGILTKLAQKYSIKEDKPRKDQPERFQHTVLYGDSELLRIPLGGKYVSINYKGIEDVIKDQYIKGILTVDFQAMLDMKACPECHGAKLRKESLHVFLTLQATKTKKQERYNIRDLHQLSFTTLTEFLEKYKTHTLKNQLLVDRITHPLLDRAQMINQLGLGYLTLNRQIDTLSGGEVQRLRLAKQLGNKLTGIVYVLDEPTIGLDDKEIIKAIAAIRRLQEMGNTIIVVEHHDAFIKASDWIVEVGPGAGDFGGEIMFNGPYEEFIKSNTLTAQYITGKKKTKLTFTHTPTSKIVKIKKASKHNLQNIDININLGSFTIITGPSGSGKTTLMYTTLYRFLDERQKFVQSYIRLQLLKKGRSRQQIISAPVMRSEEYAHYENLAVQEFYKDISVDTILGHDDIKNIIYVDQASIGKTPRSCPATFIGIFDKIRDLYAGTTEAKYLGFSSGHFSFNSGKGACTECQGYGYKKVELQFLPDTYVPCELCKGKRYKPEILDIKRHGKNINDVLQMYISDAMEFFGDIGHIKEELELLNEIGLDYVRMGQPAHMLSGGESQRLKLVKHLLKSYKGHTIYFLDEPTVGLHPSDIEKLLIVLKKFLDNGDTILMIEHDKTLLQFADHVITLDDGKMV